MARVITHNNNFHADDVVAVAILERVNALCPKGRFTIVRSRDPKVVQAGDVVVDVGGKHGVFPVDFCGGEVTYFDHHQPGLGLCTKKDNWQRKMYDDEHGRLIYFFCIYFPNYFFVSRKPIQSQCIR